MASRQVIVGLGMVAVALASLVLLAVYGSSSSSSSSSTAGRSQASGSASKQDSASTEDGANATNSSAAASGSSGSTASNEKILPKNTLLEVFVQITNQMEKVILKVSQLEQQLVNQAAQEGQQVDYEQFRQLMMNEFKNSMKDAETRVYAHYKVTEAQVEASATFFADDADFQQVLKTLKRKFALFTGQGGEDVPEHVTMQLVMDVMSETMTRMTAAMEEVFNQTRENHVVGTDAFNQALQTRYVERVGVIRAKVQKKYNLDQVRVALLVLKTRSAHSAPRGMRSPRPPVECRATQD
jgi:hypothetical protein